MLAMLLTIIPLFKNGQHVVTKDHFFTKEELDNGCSTIQSWTIQDVLPTKYTVYYNLTPTSPDDPCQMMTQPELRRKHGKV